MDGAPGGEGMRLSRSIGARLLTGGLLLLGLGGASGDGCGPLPADDGGDDTGDVSLDAGTFEDDDILVDWRLYGSWGAGACLDLKFTNVGGRASSWQFALGLDRVVTEISYPGPFPASFTAALDEVRLVPFSDPTLQPFGVVSYAVCLEPVTRPVSFRATVVRDDDGSGTPDVPAADVYGTVRDDSDKVVLEFMDRASDPTAFCLELRLGNLTTDRLEDWTARIRFDRRFELKSTDTSFYYFRADLEYLDVSPTFSSRVFDPLEVQSGTICMDAVAVPVALQASFRQTPAPWRLPGWAAGVGRRRWRHREPPSGEPRVRGSVRMSGDEMAAKGSGSAAERRTSGLGGLVERIVGNRILMQLTAAGTMLAVLIYGTATFPLEFHVVLALVAIAIGLVVTRILPEYRLVSVVLSLAMSLRYILWRGLETLNLDSGFANATVSLLLYGAEIYTVFVLIGGYFQTTLFLDRRPVPLPSDPDRLPWVDVFIPTYNEGVDIVRRTAVAAMAMDYAKKRVWILDDGRRPAMKALAVEVGCGYVTRPDNKHAKSGNINHAMAKTDGELVAFFDADHAPVRSFLTLTVGFFLQNDNLALAQTPHHFYNPDPFERNLYTFGKVPPEQNLFYHLVQVSNDFWNSTFFCGSCAVIRRAALEDVGGMAVETVTEDAHTALKMQARGWDTAYLNIPQAAGLATESFAGYVGQRIRWARGMAQILRIDPPMFKRGLDWAQRVNYTFAASHFFFGLPRMIFLLAPITYLVFGLNPLAEDVKIVLLYAAPHLMLAYVNASAANGNHRHTFWPEVYETAMAPYSALVTSLALVAPKQGSFNVTAKGEQLEKVSFSPRLVWMLLVMLALCLVGIPAFVYRIGEYPMQAWTLAVALGWNIYNITLLLAAIAASLERPQRRRTHRIRTQLSVLAVEQPPVEAESPGPEIPDAAELSEESYQSVEGVDPIAVYEDLRDDLARRMETSEASLASELRNRPSLMPSEPVVQDGVWRHTGRTIDISEEGARLLLPQATEVPHHLQLTLLGNDGSRVTVQAVVLAGWRLPEGLVVRCRFRHSTDAQVHALIRMIFSDPNAWSRDRFTLDRLGESFIAVATSPFRAVTYSLGFMRTPADALEQPAEARLVNRPVLQCYHCHGVLPLPVERCSHCGEALSLGTLEDFGAHGGTFDRAGPREGADRPGPFTYLVPALLVAAAILLSFGWEGMFRSPDASLTRDEALALSYHYSATDGASLADELARAIEQQRNVSGDWGSKVARLRFEFPRAEDPRPQVHQGPVAGRMADLFWSLHQLESRYRRGDRSTALAAEARRTKQSFQELQ